MILSKSVEKFTPKFVRSTNTVYIESLDCEYFRAEIRSSGLKLTRRKVETYVRFEISLSYAFFYLRTVYLSIEKQKPRKRQHVSQFFTDDNRSESFIFSSR